MSKTRPRPPSEINSWRSRSRPRLTHLNGTALKAQVAGCRKPLPPGGPEEVSSWSGLQERAGSGQVAIAIGGTLMRGRPETGSLS